MSKIQIFSNGYLRSLRYIQKKIDSLKKFLRLHLRNTKIKHLPEYIGQISSVFYCQKLSKLHQKMQEFEVPLSQNLQVQVV